MICFSLSVEATTPQKRNPCMAGQYRGCQAYIFIFLITKFHTIYQTDLFSTSLHNPFSERSNWIYSLAAAESELEFVIVLRIFQEKSIFLDTYQDM